MRITRGYFGRNISGVEGFGQDMKSAGWMAVALVVSGTISGTQARADLKSSMDRLDAGSKKFRSVQADFHKVIHSGSGLRLPDEPQDGKIYFTRVGGKTQVGLMIVGPGARTLFYANGVAKVYNPAQEQKCYDTVKGSNKLEMAVSLGFGGGGKEMQDSWVVTDLGEETMDGTKVEKLDLVAKDPAVKKNYTHITLWMVLDRAYSLKQVLYQPGGDSQTALYSGITYNETVDTKPFDFSGAKACGK